MRAFLIIMLMFPFFVLNAQSISDPLIKNHQAEKIQNISLSLKPYQKRNSLLTKEDIITDNKLLKSKAGVRSTEHISMALKPISSSLNPSGKIITTRKKFGISKRNRRLINQTLKLTPYHSGVNTDHQEIIIHKQ